MVNKILLILLSSLLFGVDDSIDDLTSKNYEEEIGQGIVVVEYWAGWNDKNIVTAVEELKDVKVFRVNIDTNTDLQAKNGVIVVPTIIFYDDGKEYKRLQGDLSFTLKTTKKELQKIIDEILMSKF